MAAKGQADWCRVGATASDLATKFFGTEASDRSVFQVDSELGELLVASAFYLKFERSYVEKIWLIRVRPGDIKGLLEPEPSSGNTGVKEADREHRDLVGDPMGLEAAVERTLAGFVHGEDRLRIIGEVQLTQQIKAFLAGGSALGIDAARRCRKALKRADV